MFLWYMLSHDPSFFHHHQDDPGIRAWKAEAEKMSKDNDDLKKQMVAMNAKMDQMQKDGVASKTDYMPSDADPSIAFAADRAVHEKPSSGIGFLGWSIILFLIGAGGYGVYRYMNRKKKYY